MGNEANCTVRFGKQVSGGKALLETSELIFRGEFRLKIPFAQIKSLKAVDGELRIDFPEGKASFELGPQAEKWANKILHPKSRMEKLGIKPGSKVSAIGALESEFLQELKEIAGAVTAVRVTAGKVGAGSDCVFFSAGSRKGLSSVAKIANSLKGAAALWIVYPKGQKTITENDVIASGRKAGLKDVKVVGFSATHTALKFVIPLDKR
ncbi:MAG TPA: hypothetical protein VKH15_00690 [Candidatus Acidoferrum sp.]|nr:hypothetical protein [Candidatus Acidoferrum sp.]